MVELRMKTVSVPAPPKMVLLTVPVLVRAMESLPVPACPSSSARERTIVSLPARPCTRVDTEPGAFRRLLPVVPVRVDAATCWKRKCDCTSFLYEGERPVNHASPSPQTGSQGKAP